MPTDENMAKLLLPTNAMYMCINKTPSVTARLREFSDKAYYAMHYTIQ